MNKSSYGAKVAARHILCGTNSIRIYLQATIYTLENHCDLIK